MTSEHGTAACVRVRDALPGERRRMPWLAADKEHEFDGPQGKASLPGMFEGRRQLIIYRAFWAVRGPR